MKGDSSCGLSQEKFLSLMLYGMVFKFSRIYLQKLHSYYLRRTTEQSTLYFLLQKRRGHGKVNRTLSDLFVGTIDSVFDKKPPPYRILHQTPNSEVYYGWYH